MVPMTNSWMVFVAVLAVGLFFPFLFFLTSFPGEKSLAKVDTPLLSIFVLSARDNFQSRSAVRASWGRDLSANVSLKFVIGEPCTIDPADRIDQYSCEFWNVSQVNNSSEELLAFKQKSPQEFVPENGECRDFNDDYIALRNMKFKVLFPITLKKLGVSTCFCSRNGSVYVELWNEASRSVVVRALSHLPASSGEGFVFQDTLSYLLPKGFEGSIRVYTNLVACSNSASSHLELKDNGLVSVLNEAAPLTNFVYSVFDTLSLTDHILGQLPRHQLWSLLELKNQKSLEREQTTHGDLVFVPFVDTYRNLPYKLIESAKAFVGVSVPSNESATFMMKVDDDCFVNASAIETMLRTLRMAADEYALVGNFRRNWAVQRSGKWADPEYMGLSYPDFPCGSGYALSYPLAEWISRNGGVLRKFQGEDVSMGIWCSALHIRFVQDGRFKCSTDDWLPTDAAFTVPDLSPEDLMEVL